MDESKIINSLRAYMMSDENEVEQAVKDLFTKINNLNKGIDELIKKYELKLCAYCELAEKDLIVIKTLEKVIQDLKKLKGE